MTTDDKNEIKGQPGEVGDAGDVGESGTNHPDFKAVEKPAEEKPAAANPLVTHNTGA